MVIRSGVGVGVGSGVLLAGIVTLLIASRSPAAQQTCVASNVSVGELRYGGPVLAGSNVKVLVIVPGDEGFIASAGQCVGRERHRVVDVTQRSVVLSDGSWQRTVHFVEH